MGPLKALPGAAQRLRLFRADLLEPGSFDAAVAGCDHVLHTASPFVINVRACGAGVGLRGGCGCAGALSLVMKGRGKSWWCAVWCVLGCWWWMQIVVGA